MRAAGLNFRDVLIALGVVPGRTALGSEGAGIVLEVGAEVRDLAPGDRVMGIFPEAFGPVAVAERATLARVPTAGRSPRPRRSRSCSPPRTTAWSIWRSCSRGNRC
ncbi:alcohol dehydrogenase catalytic domain-containing protein [Streptomyces sp. FXJ1.4098]|nr:alcohol dehydrogenase catalytic domain-containing protein [Streptomyces sp. FXJ1.4098]